MTIENRVAKVKKFAEKNGIKGFVEWAEHVEYMLKAYRGTKHEAHLLKTVEEMIVKYEACM